MKSLLPLLLVTLLSTVFLATEKATADEPSKDKDFQPKQTQLPVKPPADAIVLFDGGAAVEFVSKYGEPIDWPVVDGTLESAGGQKANHIVSKWHFRDADIHAEFMLSESGSSNSGLYIHGNYEMQILHSADKKRVGDGDLGAIYGFSKPLINAARDRGVWQVYDIRYRAPRRDSKGKITEKGTITAWLNGQKVQDSVAFGEPRSVYHPYRSGTTDYLKAIWKKQIETTTGPLFLQDHGHPVRFRNVWIRPLDNHAYRY
ncbi:3-keto-disaccharide hydrolase [Roseimaritima ulvae]|uniref:3-keto-alpha-glucoside-1,2-lyase/3-keto-2-hydroxy-glucal hydratase domain-containing protein n=1 Tax=Roseimaritima ulvae TaxID=980254 RepID=A0A5B9QW69_9BACT|nr:DUF1080 domain-containing protein [Roseimaritima ulvae]QEG41346.1 hypothetical protein UC8_33660 [Roseimaritima ulvae]